MTVVELGGPRSSAKGALAQTCAALRVRRLVAGELSVDESVAAEDHLAGCEKCRATRAEVEAERRALAEAVPFEAFAAGVAEKLAREQAPVVPLATRARRWAWAAASRAAFPAALAASCLLILKVAAGPGSVVLHEAAGTRTKGAASLSVFAVRAARTFALHEGEASEQGDRLLPSLEPAGHAFALVALVEPGEVSVLFKGPARAGPLPEAFEWTGSVTHARIVAVYADAPLDEAAVVAALREDSAAVIAGAQVVFHALERKGAQQAPR